MRSGFKMKGMDFGNSPVRNKVDLTKKTGKGPRAGVKKTELEKMTEEEYQRYMNDKHHSNIPTFTNSNPSPNDQALASAKSKKIKPSYPATPKGSKKRSKAENKLEKTEDEKGL